MQDLRQHPFRSGSRIPWIVLLVMAAWLGYAAPALAGAGKVAICHIPPGNPANAHTIVVSTSAIPAHLAHGDVLDACSSGCQDPLECDDGNLCTDDVCEADGSCSNLAVDCSDGDACTLDLCQADTGCMNPPGPAGETCDDGDSCSLPGVCDAQGECVTESLPGCCRQDADCEDGSQCTTHACDVATGECLDQDVDCGADPDACHVALCAPDQGCLLQDVFCDDGNVCTDDSCDAVSGCVSVPTTSPPEPGVELSCEDGIDNDCDGVTDRPDLDCCFALFESCQAHEECCSGGCFEGVCQFPL